MKIMKSVDGRRSTAGRNGGGRRSTVDRFGVTLAALGLFVAGGVQAQSVTVQVANPLPAERRDEVVALPWSAVRGLPNVAANRVRVREQGGAEVVSQVLDLDGNGQPDSLLFQASFFPSESRTFVVEPVAAATFKPRVHVKYIDERSDVAWETDRIAFRTYGRLLWQLENLHSSGVDVWVKRTRELVLDKWYGGGHDFYHIDRGEGGDFYKVGPTLGGGATAVWSGGRMYRAENFKDYKILADGPIRLVFDLGFETWDAAGVKVSQVNRIAMDAGSNLYRQTSTFTFTGADSITYALGFVKRPNLVGVTSKAQPWGWLTGWGPMENKYGEGGHGDLGTAVMLEKGRMLDVKETDDHFVALATAKSGQPTVQYVGAGWTDSGDFSKAEDWVAYLNQYARRLASPLKVTVGGASAQAAAK